ncbi:MAG: DUF434 domain-containing protein [Sedimentisphaerales bacterium]|nr:DUF434 domain-containing protein [Sedimentisphaerales bacterium]
MPDRRKHRGANPEDAKLFEMKALPDLCRAVGDMSLLLGRGYSEKSCLKLVGDRFGLTKRQRFAVMRCACSESQLKARKEKQIAVDLLKDRAIVIDGYNLLITIETFLSGGFVFIACDGCVRDIAGIHGTYRTVVETTDALELIAESLGELGVSHSLWLFDSPVSNSGKLKTLIYELIEKNSWPWEVELVINPDRELISSDKIIATGDSDVLDKCPKWTNLSAYIIDKSKSTVTNIIDLSNPCF